MYQCGTSEFNNNIANTMIVMIGLDEVLKKGFY